MLAEDVISLYASFPSSLMNRLSSAGLHAPSSEGSAPLLRNHPGVPAFLPVSNQGENLPALLLPPQLPPGLICCLSSGLFREDHKKSFRDGTFPNLLAVCLNKTILLC